MFYVVLVVIAAVLVVGLFFVRDRKSTRLNSSHSQISYADFCLKKRLQIDALSRERHSPAHSFRTFTPLFPHGYYFTPPGYTGYANLIHLKHSRTLQPTNPAQIL